MIPWQSPQIPVDGVAHGAHGSILLLDNRRMGAIPALQEVQYGSAYATTDEVVWTTSDGHVPCRQLPSMAAITWAIGWKPRRRCDMRSDYET